MSAHPRSGRHPGTGLAGARDRPVGHSGKAYCYTVFLENSDGSVATVGSTGVISVPNVGSVPPSNAPAPAPLLLESSSGFDSKPAKKAGLVAAAALAGVLGVFLLFRSARRVSHSRVVMRPTMRESIVGRNSSALVVPTVVALGWIVVVIAFVVLR